MRILVLGGTGFIGVPLVRRLLQGGHAVAVFHRGTTTADLPGAVRTLRGDRNHLSDARGDFSAFAPHVVIDLIAYTADQAEAAAAVFAGRVERAVVLSSGDVYRNYDGLRGARTQPPDPVPLREDAPLRETRYPYRPYASDEDDWLYHYDKILVEDAYRAVAALPCTILRLPAVYGPRDRQHRIFPYLKRMDDGRPALLLGTQHARWRWTRGYVENVAAAIARTATDERATGQTYNLGEADAPSEAAWVQRIATAAAWEGDVVTVPDDALPTHLHSDLDYRYDLALDTRRIRRELGYRTPVPSDEGMTRTVTWTRHHPPSEVDEGAFDYAAEDAVLRREERVS